MKDHECEKYKLIYKMFNNSLIIKDRSDFDKERCGNNFYEKQNK
jgi:hypothetical protein